MPRHLHTRVKLVWFAPSAIALLVLWLLSSAFLVVAHSELIPASIPAIFVPALALIAIAVLLVLPIFAYLHIEYMNFTYELTDTEVVIRQGVFTRMTSVIPYTRIQNINSNRSVLERLLGLATLQIETAGTNPGASEGVLPGIAHKEALIGEILGKVEKAKKTGGSGGLGGQSSNGMPNTESALLSEILKELVQLNKAINAHWGKGSQNPK